MEQKIDPKEMHEKIIGVLDDKGPSLPINIAKELSISSLFISAFLSELTNQNRIKVSSLKVGGSPLYYLDGQEGKLEDYYKYLHPRESEAYLLLKKNRVLRDRDQDPATRVALRSIKDFSVGFNVGEEVYWKYFSVENDEVDKILGVNKEENREVAEEVSQEVKEEKTIEEKKEEEKLEVSGDLEKKEDIVREEPSEKKEIVPVVKEVSKKEERNDDEDNHFNNPLIIQKEEKKTKEKPRSEFVRSVVEFIRGKGLEIIEEREYKAKEYTCLIRVRSELGPISFFTLAKDKKTITETDFKKLLSDSQSIPLPAFLLYTGEISKKAKDYLRNYGSILKAKKIQ